MDSRSHGSVARIPTAGNTQPCPEVLQCRVQLKLFIGFLIEVQKDFFVTNFGYGIGGWDHNAGYFEWFLWHFAK